MHYKLYYRMIAMMTVLAFKTVKKLCNCAEGERALHAIYCSYAHGGPSIHLLRPP